MGDMMEQVVGMVRPEIKGLFANIFKYEGNITPSTSRLRTIFQSVSPAQPAAASVFGSSSVTPTL
jgi:hypothetical protein